MTAQDFDKRGALISQPWSVLTRVVVRRLAVRSEHVGSSGRGHGHKLSAMRKAADKRLTTPALMAAITLARSGHQVQRPELIDAHDSAVCGGWSHNSRMRPFLVMKSGSVDGTSGLR